MYFILIYIIQIYIFLNDYDFSSSEISDIYQLYQRSWSYSLNLFKFEFYLFSDFNSYLYFIQFIFYSDFFWDSCFIYLNFYYEYMYFVSLLSFITSSFTNFLGSSCIFIGVKSFISYSILLYQMKFNISLLFLLDNFSS